MKKIKANLDYLCKLFIMPDSPDKFMEFGNAVLEMVHDFFQEKRGLYKKVTLPELANIFNQTGIPEDPKLIREVLQEIREKITVHSVKVGSPYYIGHMTSAIPYFMILLEMIIASLNQNQVKIETAKASSFVERELIAWMHRIVFQKDKGFYRKNIQNPRISLGNVTSGGTMSNLTALLVAREKAFPSHGKFSGVRKAGINSALNYYGYSRMAVFVSRRGHYSIQKSANILGIGEKNVINIPVNNDNRIDIKALRKKIGSIKRQDRKKGEKTKILSIIGIAGTTETGNIDDLSRLADIARKEEAYFHVDAAWGGSALIVDDYRPLFKGIERADSVSIDAHKLLYCPMSTGIIVFRNKNDLTYLKQVSRYVNRPDSVDLGRFTLEGSRPFSCLKPWAALKVLGKEGYKLLFNKAHSATLGFKAVLEESGNFEILNHPELFILNYRFVPGFVRDHLRELDQRRRNKSKGEKTKEIKAKIKEINNILNRLNITLQKSIRLNDTTFVSRTTLESTPYRPHNIVVLRAVMINPLINDNILRAIARTQNDLGLGITKQFEFELKQATRA